MLAHTYIHTYLGPVLGAEVGVLRCHLEANCRADLYSGAGKKGFEKYYRAERELEYLRDAYACSSDNRQRTLFAYIYMCVYCVEWNG